jgi:uncharacterized protein
LAGKSGNAPPPGYDFPALSGRVVDAAHLLPAAVVERVSQKSALLEQRWGHQLVVVTVSSLGGHTIEDFGVTLGRYWGIGRKDINDGVLLIVAPRERKVRIEVGYGLEKALKDEEAAAIIRHRILPHFTAGEMTEGIEAGVDGIITEISVPAIDVSASKAA